MPKGGNNITKTLLVLWLIISIAYIGFDAAQWVARELFVRTQQDVVNQSYNRGQADAVNRVIQESQKCQPFPVNVGDNRTTLIGVDCLQQGSSGQSAQEQNTQEPAE